jgi:hypothetical protein
MVLVLPMDFHSLRMPLNVHRSLVSRNGLWKEPSMSGEWNVSISFFLELM